ncbi:MAG TPA: VWA domain-containing protein [Pyrinomonadaceae bacterium]|nr:VWA domain-containing protein [Pyrinomonadaceae bacterium]
MRTVFARTALALLLLAAGAPLGALSQSRRLPPTQPQKKNPRPGEQEQKDQQQEPLPPDIVNDKEQEVVKVDTRIVNIEAVVINKKTKQIVLGLKRENFGVFEDGTPREVSNFSTPEAPITVAVVMEYSKLGQIFGYYGSGGMDAGQLEVLRPMAMFLQQFIRPPQDYASVIAYDMRPTPLTDFTNDPARLNAVVNLLLRNQPAFRETNLFDALKFTLVGGRGDSVVMENSESRTSEYTGMASLQGRRKALFLISSGVDTFSKINYDQARKIAQNAGVPIYIIGTGELFMKRYGDQMGAQDGIEGATSPGRMTMLQAKNTLQTFANETGGAYFPVTFPTELPTTLATINALMRSQYSLAFRPDEQRRDGKRRKLEVKVDVDGDGKYDDKDFIVRARQFYNPPKDEKVGGEQ